MFLPSVTSLLAKWYEKLRPMLLFGQTAASRAKETGTSERTLHYKADQFEQEGMVSLFPNERTSTAVCLGAISRKICAS